MAKDKIYVAGGDKGRTVEVIPKYGGEWTLMKARMNVERHDFGLAWFNDGLLAVGGWQKVERQGALTQLRALSSTEWLEDANPEGEWKEHIPMKTFTALFGDLVLL